MKILILGANGFIGSHLSDAILAEKKDWGNLRAGFGERQINGGFAKQTFSFS